VQIKMNVGPELYRNDKLYGSTVVGTRGQVVVPAQARKDLEQHPYAFDRRFLFQVLAMGP
jgi:hypothetical protein